MKINDSLLVTINLSDKTDESVIEVVSYIGSYRNIVNVFTGANAEEFYKTLITRQLNTDLLYKNDQITIEDLVVDTNDEHVMRGGDIQVGLISTDSLSVDPFGYSKNEEDIIDA